MELMFKQSRKELCLVGIAFILSSLFLYTEWNLSTTQEETCIASPVWLTQGYNFYIDGVGNKVKNRVLFKKKFELYDKGEDGRKFKVVSIYDPIVFSALCAWLWKLTGKPSLLPLKILNIIIFSLLMIWLFRMLQLLFEDKSKAFAGALGVVAFLPLVFNNIENIRDIYYFYGFIILLYFFFTFVFTKKKITFLIPGALLFVICFWARPCILSSFVALSGLAIIWAYFNPFYRQKAFQVLTIFWFMNGMLFWVPFGIFNKITYDMFYIFPQGEASLSSLYGVPFPDGDVMEHTGAKFILRKTGKPMQNGTMEGDAVCLKLYQQLTKKFPLHRFKCMFARFKIMLWYDLPWKKSDPHSITTETSRWFKLKLALTSPALFFEFLSRLYMRILLFLGYLGIVYALIRKEYTLLILMGLGIVFSSGYSWLCHIEERVLAVHSWPFGLFAAYFLSCCYEFVALSIKNRKKKRSFRILSTN
jgi:hypothetical protein